ncbi:hypothetical protein PR048_031709 [Dryococelus australis]|uniref:Uncharacterized protein n=1 Tax=Dryococelus australis TaxID=614101 RepID=A0ABQ9GA34_9NEOP|nr:hypothetical protein PR048_031709 [Dryococelus australis]
MRARGRLEQKASPGESKLGAGRRRYVYAGTDPKITDGKSPRLFGQASAIVQLGFCIARLRRLDKVLAYTDDSSNCFARYDANGTCIPQTCVLNKPFVSRRVQTQVSRKWENVSPSITYRPRSVFTSSSPPPPANLNLKTYTKSPLAPSRQHYPISVYVGDSTRQPFGSIAQLSSVAVFAIGEAKWLICVARQCDYVSFRLVSTQRTLVWKITPGRRDKRIEFVHWTIQVFRLKTVLFLSEIWVEQLFMHNSPHIHVSSAGHMRHLAGAEVKWNRPSVLPCVCICASLLLFDGLQLPTRRMNSNFELSMSSLLRAAQISSLTLTLNTPTPPPGDVHLKHSFSCINYFLEISHGNDLAEQNPRFDNPSFIQIRKETSTCPKDLQEVTCNRVSNSRSIWLSKVKWMFAIKDQTPPKGSASETNYPQLSQKKIKESEGKTKGLGKREKGKDRGKATTAVKEGIDKMADIHFVYGAAQYYNRAAARMHMEMCPNDLRHVIQRSQPLMGNFVNRGHLDYRALRNRAYLSQLRTCYRCTGLMLAVQLSYTTKQSVPVPTPYMLQMYRPNAGCPRSIRRPHFDEEVLRRFLSAVVLTTVELHFPSAVLCTNEERFTRECVLKSRNHHVWTEANTHAPFIRNYQELFDLKVWCGIIGDSLIGPYMLPSRFFHSCWKTFHLGFDNNFGAHVQEYVDTTFPGEWIGRGGPRLWPARSPDLTPLDFYLWSAVKCLAEARSPQAYLEDLVAIIHAAADIIRTTPGVLGRGLQSLSPPTNENRVRVHGGVASGFSHVGIMPNDAAGRRVFLGISRFPSPLHSGAPPLSPPFSLICSLSLKTSMLGAAKFSLRFPSMTSPFLVTSLKLADVWREVYIFLSHVRCQSHVLWFSRERTSDRSNIGGKGRKNHESLVQVGLPGTLTSSTLRTGKNRQEHLLSVSVDRVKLCDIYEKSVIEENVEWCSRFVPTFPRCGRSWVRILVLGLAPARAARRGAGRPQPAGPLFVITDLGRIEHEVRGVVYKLWALEALGAISPAGAGGAARETPRREDRSPRSAIDARRVSVVERSVLLRRDLGRGHSNRDMKSDSEFVKHLS